MVPTLIHIYLAMVSGLLSFGCTESPRWHVKVNRMEDAERAPVKIRNLPVEHAFVQHELDMNQIEI